MDLNCENFCDNYTDNALKLACYDGCAHISPTNVESSTSGMSFFRTHIGPFFTRMCDFFKFGEIAKFLKKKFMKYTETTKPPSVEETHVRIIIPGGPIEGPHMMNGENMRMTMHVMNGPDAEFSGPVHMVQVPPDGETVDVSNFAPNFCFSARTAFHHIATHPLFMASVILMFVTSVSLLIIACSRLSAQRARKAIFERQYRRMPGFFRSPSLRFSLLTTQPPSDDEAPELPPKEPIV
ncbi:hypothetical protein Aperf_G00000074264 [Anoplocephala perfoliata]